MTSKHIEVHGRLWLTLNGKPLLGKGRMELLSHIESTGSISKAAKAMKMSYKAAWDAVDAMNNALGTPVVESATGGSRGGGSRLTETGKRLMLDYRSLEDQHRQWLAKATVGLSRRSPAKGPKP
jgi:molybdate transport system regulatory protein